MSAAALLERAKAAGVTVLVRDGGMKVIGQPDAIRPFLDDLRGSKAEILALLESEKTAANDAKSPIDQTAAATAQDAYCWPNSDAMNTTELALMATRLATFARIGLPVDQAEKLADKLLHRDREHDDRRMCLECLHCQYGRCSNSRAAGLNHPELGQDYALLLKHCNGYTAGIGTLAGPVLGFVQVPKKPPQQYHPLNTEAKQLARAYHDHHFNCPKCRTGRGERCQRGTELWKAYAGGDGDGR